MFEMIAVPRPPTTLLALINHAAILAKHEATLSSHGHRSNSRVRTRPSLLTTGNPRFTRAHTCMGDGAQCARNLAMASSPYGPCIGARREAGIYSWSGRSPCEKQKLIPTLPSIKIELVEKETGNPDPKTNFRLIIIQTELERFKFLVRSFLRTRIAKVSSPWLSHPPVSSAQNPA